MYSIVKFLSESESGMDKQEIVEEKMYQAALLKIAMKMRKKQPKGFNEIFTDILYEMKLDPEEFRSYVNANMESLMATVKRRGY